MPELSAIVSNFGTDFLTDTGLMIRGQLKAAPSPRVGYDGKFAPRGLLITPAGSNGAPGQVIKDQAGTRFLTGSWDSHFYQTIATSVGLVLFQISHDCRWTRKMTTYTEPVSGLTREGNNALIAVIPCVVELISRTRDADGLTYKLNRILTNADLQLDDLVDGMRVQYTSSDLGLTYAESI